MASAPRSPWADRASSLYDQDYARRYRAHDESLPESGPSRELAAWIREVCTRFGKPIDVLDLGCGTGRYFWALTGVKSLVGVDASAAMLAEAKRPYRAEHIAIPEITLQQGDLLAQRFDRGAFDLVYSIGVLAEHAPLTPALMADVASWLRPDGRFAFTTVHPDSPSVPKTLPRRVATVVSRLGPALVAKRLNNRLLSGGLYADEAYVQQLATPAFAIESLDQFTSEAHLHVRAVLRRRS